MDLADNSMYKIYSILLVNKKTSMIDRVNIITSKTWISKLELIICDEKYLLFETSK